MPVPSRLRVEPLEDRLVPSADPVRLLVSGAGGPAAVAASPLVAGVQPVGDGLLRADLRPGADAAAVVAALLGRPGVTAAHEDHTLAPAALPNDPAAAGMWHYAATSAAAAWDVSTGTGQTIVAVIDTGVDVTHPDLAANIWRNPREVPGNGRDDDNNGLADDVHGWNFAHNSPDVSDAAGHGTHAAGIIGAVGNNRVGVSGVNWRARVMPLKFMPDSGGGFTSDAVRAIDYAVANGAKVISASWGGGPHDPTLLAAVQRARAAGVVVVTAAGNQGADADRTPFFPAGYAAQSDNVVSVAATSRTDALATWSNYGPATVSTAAPGSLINSTLPGGRYGTKSGTSMAAPFVAGAVSLLWDARPDWSYRQVLDKLRQSVDVLPGLAGKVASGGRIDLGQLLDAASPPASPPVPPPPPAPAPTPPSTPGPPTASPAGVLAGVIGGPRAGTVDRAWVRFAGPTDPQAVGRSVEFTTPLGSVRASAVRPVAGTNNTQFVLMLPRLYTAAGVYRLSVGGPAAADRFVREHTLGTVATAGRTRVAAVELEPAAGTGRVAPPVAATPVREVSRQPDAQPPRADTRDVRTEPPAVAARPDAVARPHPVRLVGTPADVTGWLVGRLQDRLG